MGGKNVGLSKRMVPRWEVLEGESKMYQNRSRITRNWQGTGDGGQWGALPYPGVGVVLLQTV